MFLELAVNSLIQDMKGKGPHIIRSHRRTFSEHEKRAATAFKDLIVMREPLKAKFILFRERDSHVQMNDQYFPDHAAKFETTFRIGLKGGLHFLFNPSNPSKINSIHFDGHKHLKRNISTDRVISRLNAGLRDYCTINDIIDDRTGNHNKNDSQHYDDCQFLNLTDLLVGAFRTVLSDTYNTIQKEVSLPVQELVQKWNKGGARMLNSRWNKGFCISECYLDNNQWSFNNLINKDSETMNQIKIF